MEEDWNPNDHGGRTEEQCASQAATGGIAGILLMVIALLFVIGYFISIIAKGLGWDIPLFR